MSAKVKLPARSQDCLPKNSAKGSRMKCLILLHIRSGFAVTTSSCGILWSMATPCSCRGGKPATEVALYCGSGCMCSACVVGGVEDGVSSFEDIIVILPSFFLICRRREVVCGLLMLRLNVKEIRPAFEQENKEAGYESNISENPGLGGVQARILHAAL